MGWFNSKKEEEVEPDDRPVAPWQNASQKEVPVNFAGLDDHANSLWETADDEMIKATPIFNEGDD
jgi:hypothetical protein